MSAIGSNRTRSWRGSIRRTNSIRCVPHRRAWRRPRHNSRNPRASSSASDFCWRGTTDPRKTGSSASLLVWEKLGRAGREFISSGPRREDISAFSGREGLEPVRVYVGLRSAATPEARAKLALEELKRVGGFERSVLIVVTPTGTGWVDPAAIDSVEYLHDGAVASVALQYSYLASWLSLLLEPGYGADAARALFNEIYGYWITLPKDSRPRLYLHGLGLGAMNSEQSTDLIEVLGDPFA